ncbi:molecular chaperone [Entomohabitans teleogrylli]|uniref:fimbrial biogenesis chaperone n=1 Tax=Entomohabitans teleogrylli TaxID=1384589 RepID=UPI00073D3888|nr:molecular chaperone [Entomohabitans teleogrylli]
MKKRVLVLSICALPLLANASVVLENTRIIYDGGKEGKTVKITNNDATPYIVQLWTDSGNTHSRPGESNAPFIILPPSFKMTPNSVQTTRIIYNGSPLPGDRESIFYFNMVQVPPVQQNQNAMAVVLKNRVKIFYRPAGIAAPGARALEAGLSFRAAARGVSVTNQSPYFVSVVSALMNCTGNKTKLSVDMVKPLSNDAHWSATTAGRPGCTIDYTYVNDFGGKITARAKIE